MKDVVTKNGNVLDVDGTTQIFCPISIDRRYPSSAPCNKYCAAFSLVEIPDAKYAVIHCALGKFDIGTVRLNK